MATTYEKATEIDNAIAELTTRINSNIYSNAQVLSYKRSRTAYKANLTRLLVKLEKEQEAERDVDADLLLGKFGIKNPCGEVAVGPIVEVRRPSETKVELVDAVAGLIDADANIVVKSPVTSASLGLVFNTQAPPQREFKKQVYFEVLATHSRTNFTS